MSSFVNFLSVISSVYFSGPTLPIFAEILLDRGVPPLLKYTLVIRCDQKEVQQNRQPAKHRVLWIHHFKAQGWGQGIF